VVSEEKIFEKSLQTDDGRQLMAIAHTGELKIAEYVDLDRLDMFAAINIYIFICSDFDVHCRGCDNIPFWRWLKRNQTFSASIICNDFDREYLSNLQTNNVTGCFGEYLCTCF
jgi:hypothetical protein